MSRAESAVFLQMKAMRKDLADKQDRVRDEVATAGHELRRLSPQRRRVFSDCGLAIRLIDDVESQILAGASDDVPGTISSLIGLLKQLQTAVLPGNATPVQGTPHTPAPRPGPIAPKTR
jgi:hypothetical protein